MSISFRTCLVYLLVVLLFGIFACSDVKVYTEETSIKGPSTNNDSLNINIQETEDPNINVLDESPLSPYSDKDVLADSYNVKDDSAGMSPDKYNPEKIINPKR